MEHKVRHNLYGRTYAAESGEVRAQVMEESSEG